MTWIRNIVCAVIAISGGLFLYNLTTAHPSSSLPTGGAIYAADCKARAYDWEARNNRTTPADFNIATADCDGWAAKMDNGEPVPSVDDVLAYWSKAIAPNCTGNTWASCAPKP